MEKHYTFSNLLGKVYTDGNVLFPVIQDAQGNNKEVLLSPVGNRVSTFDISNNNVRTTIYGHKQSVNFMSLSHDGKILILGSHDGQATFLTYPQGIVLRKEQFPALAHCAYFSEDSKYIAVTGNKISIFKTDHNFTNTMASRPVLLDQVSDSRYYTCVDWIGSEFIAVGSGTPVVHLYKVSNIENSIKLTDGYVLAGFSNDVLLCNFVVKNGKKDPSELIAVDKSGKTFHWVYSMEEQEWTIKAKHNLRSCHSAAISFEKNLLALGVDGGYIMYSLEDFSEVQSLNVTQSGAAVTSIAFNHTGDWLALAVRNLGQLIIWDWNAQTYIIKQQSHVSNVSKISYSQIGDMIASGDNEGKIKVWDTKTGQSFVTLEKHTGPITGIRFSRPPGSRDPAIFTSSADGTCRAFDMLRYKNFRTYQAPSTVGFSCLALDESGEILAAGGQSDFNIYIWNVQTSKLVDTLTSHEGPITAMAFSPVKSLLISGSWDKTVKVWDIFGSKSSAENLEHPAEVVAVAFRPDGEQICVATTDGTLTFWDVAEGKQVGFIECQRDITVAFNIGDEQSQLKLKGKKFFTSVTYTTDGTCVIAGGKSQFLNMYSVEQQVLVKRFVLTTNTSISGVTDLERFYVPLELLNKKHLLKQKAQKRKKSKIEKVIGDQDIPGSKEELIPEISVQDMCFSPTSREFAVASVEGVLVFSSDVQQNFQPLDVDVSITSETIMKALKEGRFGDALMMAIRLNEKSILSTVFNAIPMSSVDVVARSIPNDYVERFIAFLSAELENNVRLEFALNWAKSLMYGHSQYLMQENQLGSTIFSTKSNVSTKISASLRALLRAVHNKFENLSKIANENQYSLEYISTFGPKHTKIDIHKQQADEEMNTEEDEENEEQTEEQPKKKARKQAKQQVEVSSSDEEDEEAKTTKKQQTSGTPAKKSKVTGKKRKSREE